MFRAFRYGFAVLAVLYAGARPSPAAASVERLESDLEVARLEARMLSARRLILTGEFTIDVSTTEGAQAHNRQVRWHIWRGASGMVRQERTLGATTSVMIVDGSYGYEYVRTPGAFENPDRTKRRMIGRTPVADLRLDRPPFAFADPLTIMFNPVRFGFLSQRTIESLVNASGRTDLQSKESRWKGYPSIDVTFQGPRPGNVYEYRVVPSLGYNIVSWDFKREDPPNSGRWSGYHSSAEVAQIAPGIWFPTHVQWEEFVNDAHGATENWQIEANSINVPIDGQVFSLAAGDLPPNIVVASDAQLHHRPPPTTQSAQRKSGRVYVWDGAAVRPMTDRDAVEIKTSHLPRTYASMRFRTLALALSLGGVALAVLGRAAWLTVRGRSMARPR